MADKSRKVLSFPQPVPAKADYQRVKSSYSIREIKQMFGLSERTIRRWTENGIIQAAVAAKDEEVTYDFQALTLFRRVRDMRSQGLTIKQIEAGENIAEAYCNLRIIDLDRGNMVGALDNFTQSLKHDPRHVEANYNLANLYYDAGDFPLARLHYEAATQIEPNFSLVYYNLALVYHRL